MATSIQHQIDFLKFVRANIPQLTNIADEDYDKTMTANENAVFANSGMENYLRDAGFDVDAILEELSYTSTCIDDVYGNEVQHIVENDFLIDDWIADLASFNV